MADVEDSSVDRRIDGVLAVARELGVSVPLREMAGLLPPDVASDPEGVMRWLAAHPGAGRLVGDRVVPARATVADDWEERRARGRRFLAEAERLVEGPLAPVQSLLRCVAVTGSVAYGEPAAGDDLDFFLVTREGAVWPVLLWSFWAARRRRAPGGDSAAHWCFNSVLEEPEAWRTFGRAQGFLFAREALTARPVWGDEYYRSLVGASSWMRAEIPLLYRTWAAGGLPPPPPFAPASPAVRAVNFLIWPWLAAYLAGKALLHNHRLRRRGEPDRGFRVIAEPRRMEVRTARFEGLRRLYARGDPRETS